MSHAVIGIDFGIMECVVAALGPGGETVLIPNAAGGVVTPSVVYFGAEGETLIGDDAVIAAESDPSRAVLGIRRRLGDTDWTVDVAGAALGAVDLASLVLGSIASDATAALGAVAGAVIAVPASFHDGQRRALVDAAAGAGLPVLRLINEPTAAVLAHAAVMPVRGTVLVYGLAEGHCDVTVLELPAPDAPMIVAATGEPGRPEECSEDLIARSAGAIHGARAVADKAPADIDAVIVAGDLAEDPAAIDLLRTLLEREPLTAVDATEAVARGAALRAAQVLAARNAPIAA